MPEMTTTTEFPFTNVEPSANWKPGKKPTARKSVRHTIQAAASMMRSAARREGFDRTNLAELLELRAELDAALQAGVNNLRRQGDSWADIGDAAGITRAAACNRWGTK